MKQVRYFSFSEKLSHSVISQTCLAYLLQFNTCEPLDINLHVSSPLAKYAAEHWITHAHSGYKNKSQSSSVFALMMKLLADENSAFANWVQIYDIDGHHMDLQQHRVKIAGPLYYASLAGLTEASYALLKLMADINAQGGEYGNALQAAASEGHLAIVKLLIKKGANVNAWGGRYGNALYAASYQGHKAIVKLLIDKEADVNAQGGYYENALQAALYGGYEAIAKLLIEKGADVNTQGGEYGSALYAASYHGHKTIAKLLKQKGADVNAQGAHYGNALQAASYGGYEAIATLLIENGADVNAQGGYYGNALDAALYQGVRVPCQLSFHSHYQPLLFLLYLLKSLQVTFFLLQVVFVFT